MRMSYQKIAVTFIPVFLPFHFLLLLKTVAASKCCYWKKYKERRWKDEKNCIYIHSAYYSSIINHYTHYRKKRPKQLIKLPLKKNFSFSFSLFFILCFILRFVLSAAVACFFLLFFIFLIIFMVVSVEAILSSVLFFLISFCCLGILRMDVVNSRKWESHY